MPGAVRSVLWKMNPGLATLRRLFDAVCLKFCESNDPLMEASPLPEWWAKCDPGAARQQCTMSALFTLHTVNSVQIMYKMLWAKTEALCILHIVQIVQIVHRIFTECTKNVESGIGGPGKQKDWSFRQQGGKEGVANKIYLTFRHLDLLLSRAWKCVKKQGFPTIKGGNI